MTTKCEIEAFWKATEETVVLEEILAQDSVSRLATCSLDEMILLFRHYRLFTMRHIDDLAIVMSRLPFGEFKAFLSKVLYEEFGMEGPHGFAENHVTLLDHFIVSLGSSHEYCRDPSEELSSNIKLLDGITEQVQNRSALYAIGLRGMGTECLCQVYLTTIFNMAEKNPNFEARRDSLDLRFEQLHRGEIEAEHRRQMRARIGDMVMADPALFPELREGYEFARVSFHSFFENIYAHIDATKTGRAKKKGAAPARANESKALRVGP